MMTRQKASVIDGVEAVEGSLGVDTWIVVPPVLVQSGDHGHLLSAEAEVEQVNVLDQALNFDALGNNLGSALNAPTEKDLRRRLIVTRSDFLDLGQAQGALVNLGHAKLDIGGAGKVTVCSDLNILLSAHAEEFRLLKVGVHLDLEDSGLNCRILEDLVDKGRVDI